MEMRIGKPYLEARGGTARLCAEIDIPKEGRLTLFFETEEKWGQYFVTELSDAFILAVLKRAMKKKWDICFETPMSEDLCYQLTTYGIPILSDMTNIYQKIELKGKTTTICVPTAGKAGTGFSGGVDSFYTVLKHKDSQFAGHEVTHLVLARNGAASSSETEEIARSWFDASNAKLAEGAKMLGMEYISIWSNIPDFYRKDFCGNGCVIVTSAFIHALRKLFKIYYWASAYQADVLSFKQYNRILDGGFIEPFTVSLVSVEGLRFYHSGAEVKRVEKVEYIADSPEAQKSLIVCGEESACNCGSCVKCLRTMAELNSIGKLEQFRESFPVDKYLKNQTGKLAYEFVLDHPPFTTDIRKSMKKHGKKIPVSVWLESWFIYLPYHKLRETLKNNYTIRKLYYRLHLDEKTGRKHSEAMKERRLAECKRGRK